MAPANIHEAEYRQEAYELLGAKGIPETRLRENWAKTNLISAWFPELAITLSRQQK